MESQITEALESKYPDRFRETDFMTSTDTVAQMLFKVLEQSDNSENPFDDSFYVGHLLECLGLLDNFSHMPGIAEEIYRQFKLDQISNSSPHYAISIGAIKAYFSLRKQIYIYRTVKEQNLDTLAMVPQNQIQLQGEKQDILLMAQQNEEQSTVCDFNATKIKETERFLDEMKTKLSEIFTDPYTPLQIRLFIFHRCIKNVFYHKHQSFVEALHAILTQIHQLHWQQELKFSIICLRELTLYLEGPDLTKKLQFTELYDQNSLQLEGLIQLLWNNFICHPCNYLSCELTFWAKRLL